MDDLTPTAKWCSVLALVLLCACSANQTSHSLSEPAGQVADRYSEWEPSGYQCKWGPESSGFTADKLLDQYGACGMTRTRTITPMQYDPVTGLMHVSGTPYQVIQMDDAMPSSRRIYADFYRKITVKAVDATPQGNGLSYVGIAPGMRKPEIVGGGEVQAFLLGSKSKAIGVVATSSFASAGLAANWLARYTFVDFTDSEGKAMATFAIDFSGRIGRGMNSQWREMAKAGRNPKTGASAYLSAVPGGASIKDFFLRWQKSPQMIYGLRLHNR